MFKKFCMAAVLSAAVIFNFAPNNAEAYEHFVGNSPATGWDCYVITDSIERVNDVTYATLKMYDNYGAIHYLGYRFWYDSSSDVMRFANDEGYSGIANRYETPIEWEMIQVTRQY